MSDQAQRFLDDVLQEPETLEHVLDVYQGGGSPLRGLELDGVGRVLFIGMGSSRFAALPVASILRARDDAAAERSSSFVGTPAGADVLAVCISANGATVETLEHAERNRGVSRVVAVTNKPESELARIADVVLPLEAGEERGGVACRTYQATLAVLVGGAVEGAALTIEHPAKHPLCAVLVETSVAELLAAELWRRSLTS